MAKNPSTRRGLSSMLSSIYDPLGLGAPFLLKERLIIQQLCRDRLSWDEPIDEKSSYEWLKWKNTLVTMQNINVPRCYKPTDFGQIVEYTLHQFSDASETGYGQASYLRMINENGDVHCCLIFGKSRVAPVKYVSIPRLELTAATLSVRVSDMLRKELDIPVASEEFWTDIQVVVSYISNDACLFKTFVANRVQFIRENTKVQQWHYVSSQSNPADYASRGLDARNLEKIHRWFFGLSFLWSQDNDWINSDKINPVIKKDPELKKEVRANFTATDDIIISRIDLLTTKWLKMKKIMAWVILAKEIWTKRIKKPTSDNLRKLMNVELLEKAANSIVIMAQVKSFWEEIRVLSAKSDSRVEVNKSSKLYKLDPFLDNDGLLRVGGRLGKSRLSYSEAHPLVLLKQSNISEAIIQ